MRGHLLKTIPEKSFQLALIEEAVGGNFFRYFFQMPTLARFELETHQRVERGEPLTADSMIDLMADLFAEGFGPNFEMDRERVGMTYIVAGLAAIVLSALLFTARFQILSHNASERVVYSGGTCYLVDDRGSTALLFCPLDHPRTVTANMSNIERTGRIENIFSPLDDSSLPTR